MRNKLKFALLAFFVAVVLVGPAGAATINDTAALTGYTPYNIAYEIYNNALGINADVVPVYVHNTAALASSESKDLRVFNGKVNLSGQNVLLLSLGSNITFTGATCTAALVPGTTYIVGESASGAVPSADISIQVYDGPTFCTRNNLGGTGSPFNVTTGATSYISTGMGTVNVNTGVATINLFNALNFNVDPDLNPTCTFHPVVQLAYISQNETSIQTTILVITPQFTGSQVGTALNAELNTDTDFETFKLLSGPYVVDINNILAPAFTINNLQAATPGRWKAWVASTNTGAYAFQLNSINPEPSLTITASDSATGSNCVANTSNTAWSCGQSGQLISAFTNPPGFTRLAIHNTGTVEMNPTIWSITNATITISGGTITTACFAPSGPIGVWFGGLEVLVPFVKGDVTNGYDTYIKLFNRYTKDAKLYVATFKDGVNGPMIISTTQITGKEVIPMQSATNPNGVLQITAADIASICPTCNMVTGIPVKFLVRVPSQMGTTTFNGSGTISADDDDDVAFSGSVAHTNQFDPYVEGIVVSTSPQGQRSIPLEFKSFKNGEYNQ
jgi:hypothetical protein